MDRSNLQDEEIQPVVLPLPGFKYHHGPGDNAADDRSFVGRDDLIRELRSVLENTRDRRGSYLIAGFRGAGKTSVINKVLDLYAGSGDYLSWLPGGSNGYSPTGREQTEPRRRSRVLKAFLESGKCRLETQGCVQSGSTRRDGSPYRDSWWIRACDWWMRCGQAIRRPLIRVRINLGSDQVLKPDTVLFNTATLLYREFERVEKRPLRWLWARVLYLLVMAALTVLMTVAVPSWHRPFSDLDFRAAALHIFEPYFNLPQELTRDSARATKIDLGTSANQRLTTVNTLARDTLRDPEAYAPLILLLILLWFPRYVVTRWIPTPARILRKLSALERRITTTEEINRNIGIRGWAWGRRNTSPPLDAPQIEAELLHILDECRKVPRLLGRPDVVFVFDELDKIGAERAGAPDAASLEDYGTRTTREVYQRKERMDALLSSIKNFVTVGKARFFFIAGQEMLDSYQGERGSASSLYESLFNRVFAVPSLLTDRSIRPSRRIVRLVEAFVCRRLMPPDSAAYLWFLHEASEATKDRPGLLPHLSERGVWQYEPFRLRTYYHYLVWFGVGENEARRSIFHLRHLVHFLTLHSWGNCKRLNSLFEHLIKPIDAADWRALAVTNQQNGNRGDGERLPSSVLQYVRTDDTELVLQLGLMDQQRILLASNIFIPLHHHLHSQLAAGSDKLAVSTFAALQYVLKFHRNSFVRNHLDRMDESLHVHRSPELSSAIDTLLTMVLRPHLRRIRNGMYRYRFGQGFAQEIRYISRISDIESAAFNFSLDATAGVKRHFVEMLRKMREQGGPLTNDRLEEFASGLADINLALGDLFAEEQSFDQAVVHYQDAVDCLGPVLQSEKKKPADRKSKAFQQYVESMLKLGEVNERRQRYERAAAAYFSARAIIEEYALPDDLSETHSKSSNTRPKLVGEALKRGDSKWDGLKQALWASYFLNLKRSPRRWLDEDGVSVDVGRWYRSGRSDVGDDEAPHYRLGQLAFFYGEYKQAATRYMRVLELSSTSATMSQSSENEQTVYLLGNSRVHLAECLFVWLMTQLPGGNREESEGLEKPIDSYRDALTDLLWGKEGTEPVIVTADLKGLITSEHLSDYDGISDIVQVLEGKGKDFRSLDISPLFGLLALAAERFAQFGLTYQASMAYRRMLAYWTAMIEAIPVTLSESPSDVEETPIEIGVNPPWLDEVRLRAGLNVHATDGHAFVESWNKWKSADISGWKADGFISASSCLDNKLKGFVRRVNAEQGWRGQRSGTDSATECRRRLASLKSYESGHRLKMDVLVNSTLATSPTPFDESPNWFDSINFQQLLAVSHWERLISGCAKIKTLQLSARMAKFEEIERCFLPSSTHYLPHATHSLAYLHWLRGRLLAEKVVVLLKIKCARSIFLNKKYQHLASPNHNRYSKFVRPVCRATEYRDAARAIHNLYRAHYYIRQMDFNDHDLVFPTPGLIHYTLWRLLAALVSMEGRCSSPGSLGNSPADERVREKLTKCGHWETPGAFLDFRGVCSQAQVYLSDMEQLTDPSSRARSSVLREKYYLADDYEDSEFRMDWTLIHMLAPSARLMRLQIKKKSEQLGM